MCQKVINALGMSPVRVRGCPGGACGKTSGQRGQLEQSPGMEAFLTDQGTAKRPLWMEGKKGKRVAGSEGSGRKTRGCLDMLSLTFLVEIPVLMLGFVRLEFWERAWLEIHIWEIDGI